MVTDLRQLRIFADFNDDELACFTTPGYEYNVDSGAILCNEGDPPKGLFVLLDGELEIVKQIGGEERLLAVMQPGSFIGEISLLTGLEHTATARATQPSRLLRFEASQFEGVQENPVIALLLRTMAERLRNTEQSVQQHQKLSALGKISAGMAHEINNPAAASLRAAEELPHKVEAQQSALLELSMQGLSPDQFGALRTLHDDWIVRAAKPNNLSPLARGDREDALATWMDERGIESAWGIAPMLVAANVTEAELDRLEQLIGTEALPAALSWLENSLTVSELIRTLNASSSRIVELVRAVKAYSYMDQSPIQDVNIHDGIENTLMILGHKLKYIHVVRDYDPNLPRVTVYGSELNQVWTNIIDNAIDALDGRGTITIRTYHDLNRVVVEIGDNGPGIPPDIQERIFEPFFTTKAVGKGTGMGLDIVWQIVTQKHKGGIRVTSQPGDTRFEVYLPTNRSDSD
ncbi:MAG: ATP-binding protein [Anaerolineae bacterium]